MMDGWTATIELMFYNLMIRERDKERGWTEIMPNLLFMVGLGVGNKNIPPLKLLVS